MGGLEGGKEMEKCINIRSQKQTNTKNKMFTYNS